MVAGEKVADPFVYFVYLETAPVDSVDSVPVNAPVVYRVKVSAG